MPDPTDRNGQVMALPTHLARLVWCITPFQTRMSVLCPFLELDARRKTAFAISREHDGKLLFEIALGNPSRLARPQERRQPENNKCTQLSVKIERDKMYLQIRRVFFVVELDPPTTLCPVRRLIEHRQWIVWKSLLLHDHQLGFQRLENFHFDSASRTCRRNYD